MGLLNTLVQEFLMRDNPSMQKLLTPTQLQENQKRLDFLFKEIYKELANFNEDYLVHTHDAADIVSGILDIDRMGTGGTGTGLKALFDDNTWKVVTSGGGSGGGSGAIIDLGDRLDGGELIDVGNRI